MFKTEDMTLVAALKVRGIEPTSMEKANGGVRWCFDSPAAESQIEDLLREYNDDECYMEVRDFTKKTGMVRRNMYDFLGHKHSPVRQ